MYYIYTCIYIYIYIYICVCVCLCHIRVCVLYMYIHVVKKLCHSFQVARSINGRLCFIVLPLIKRFLFITAINTQVLFNIFVSSFLWMLFCCCFTNILQKSHETAILSQALFWRFLMWAFSKISALLVSVIIFLLLASVKKDSILKHESRKQALSRRSAANRSV